MELDIKIIMIANWNEFTGMLKAHEIQISMDRRGRALDNIFVERLRGGASSTKTST
jgi:transposase InsO family protein